MINAETKKAVQSHAYAFGKTNAHYKKKLLEF